MKMKAIVLESAGGVENLITREVARPISSDQEVLVEVKAICINPVDYKVRMFEEVLSMICGEGYPAILGWDIAGTVVSVGDQVTQFKPGDRVFGMVNFPGRGNAYAEYVAAPADHLARVPENASDEEAAATTLAALTALQVLQNTVKKGDKVLIHAGSGGVGHFAIQIAKHLGAYVIATSSAKNRDFVLGLGADQHIDYRTQAFEEVLSDLDFVLDGLAGDVLINSVKITRAGGAVISLPAPNFSEEVIALAKERNVNVSFLLVTSSGKDMRTLSEWLERGIIKPHVSQTFSFDEMGAAHRQQESGRTVGKIVVRV